MTTGYQVTHLPFEMTMAWSLSNLAQAPHSLFGDPVWQEQPIPFFRHSRGGDDSCAIDLPFFHVRRQQLIASDDGALRLPLRGSTEQYPEQARLTVLDISILDPRILVEAHVDDRTLAVVAGPWALPGAPSSFRAFGVSAGNALTLTARAIGARSIEEAIIFVRVGFGQPRRPL